jgi:hypothetical protein
MIAERFYLPSRGESVLSHLWEGEVPIDALAKEGVCTFLTVLALSMLSMRRNRSRPQ